MIDASDPEFIRLLARLKLSVRRQLEYNIDLARLQKDAQQALEVLKEIEDVRAEAMRRQEWLAAERAEN